MTLAVLKALLGVHPAAVTLNAVGKLNLNGKLCALLAECLGRSTLNESSGGNDEYGLKLLCIEAGKDGVSLIVLGVDSNLRLKALTDKLIGYRCMP